MYSLKFPTNQVKNNCSSPTTGPQSTTGNASVPASAAVMTPVKDQSVFTIYGSRPRQVNSSQKPATVATERHNKKTDAAPPNSANCVSPDNKTK